MQRLSVVCVIIVSWLLPRVASETEHHLSSIFRPNEHVGYCDLHCPGQARHTLCELPSSGTDDPNPVSDCPMFQQPLGGPWLQHNLLNAHNGVRNRFAGRFRIANMKKLVWDDELARMARLWLVSCERYSHDPCTQLHNPDIYTRDYRNVRQNVAFVVERYLPRYYDIDVIRRWYMQKGETPRPRLEGAGLHQALLNNYTLLTWASLERVGCAAAKYRDGFQLVCNYFPFYSLSEPAGLRGPPASSCPRTFPLRSRIFEALCTFEMDSANTAGANRPGVGMVLTSLLLLRLGRTISSSEILTGTGR
uniref:SCP domain-containing protein n=1 Tax=Anopheles albimanus TaxID=7167 RepID=A0A182FI45_ANOAL